MNLRPPGYELLSSRQTLALQGFCVHFWPQNREKPEGRIQCIHGVIFWYGSRCGSSKFARFWKCSFSGRMGHYGSTPLFTSFGEKRGYSIGVVIVNCGSQFVKKLFQATANAPTLLHQLVGKYINNTKDNNLKRIKTQANIRGNQIYKILKFLRYSAIRPKKFILLILLKMLLQNHRCVNRTGKELAGICLGALNF